MRPFQYLFAVSVISFLLCSCGTQESDPLYITFSGTVMDTAGEPIAGAIVGLTSSKTRYATTDNSGRYSFNIQTGVYKLFVNRFGYDYLETNISVGTGRTGVSFYNATLQKSEDSTVPTSTASAPLDKYLAINNGIYYVFAPSSDTEIYYWSHYETFRLPNGDDAIIENLLSKGVASTAAYTKGYSYDLKKETSYTICTVAFDKSGNRGPVCKQEVETKSTVNQPEAKITIRSIQSGIVTLDVVRNSYCNTYSLSGWKNLDEGDVDLPDIYWAGRTYFDGKNVYSQNLSIFEIPDWPINKYGTLVTLGYDSEGKVSGVIDKKIFTTKTNTVLSSPNQSNDGNLRGSEEKKSMAKVK